MKVIVSYSPNWSSCLPAGLVTETGKEESTVIPLKKCNATPVKPLEGRSCSISVRIIQLISYKVQMTDLNLSANFKGIVYPVF